MSTLIAERGDAAYKLVGTASKNGFIAGLTIEAAVYDTEAAQWLNMSTGVWQGAKSVIAMSEPFAAYYEATIDLSNLPPTSARLVALYEVTGGVTSGAGHDEIIVVNTLYDVANATDQAAILADTTDIQPKVAAGETAWITATGFATEAKQDVIDANVDAILVDTTAGGAGPWTTGAGGSAPTVDEIADAVWDELQAGHVAPGSFGEYLDAKVSVAGGSGLDAAGVRAAVGLASANLDTQLSTIDTNVDAVLVDTTAGGAGPWTQGGGLDAVGVRAAVGLAAANLDAQLGTIDSNVDAVLADTTAGGAGPWTTGDGGSAPTAEDIADAVWDEALGAHAIAGSAGKAAADILADTADMQPKVAVGESAWLTAVGFSTLVANDVIAPLQSYGDTNWATAAGFAIPGDSMAITGPAEAQLVDAVWDESNAGHLGAGTMGFNQDQAATGGAGVTPLQIAQAVWDAPEALYNDASSMGELLHGAGGGSSPGAVAAAVWGSAQAGYVTPGTFGFYLDGQVTSAGDAAAIADAVWDESMAAHVGAGSTGATLSTRSSHAEPDLTNLDVPVSSRSSHGAPDLSNIDVAVSTRATAASVSAVEALAAAVKISTDAGGAGPWTQTTGFAVPGDAMTLTQPALDAIENEILDADNASHLTAGTIGFNQDQAAAGGAGVTPIQISDAVWGALQAAYTASGSMGRAMADGASLPSDLTAALNRYFQTVRQYGPIAIQQPIAVKDEIHAGDVGQIITIPVVLDGAYSDLADATSIDFIIQPPDSDTIIVKAGLGVTTTTGSYTTWTTDGDVFGTVGRWRAYVTVTWPDATVKQSLVYAIEVAPPLPLI